MEEIIVIAIAFAIGGILKGATGAGAPIVAVPVLVLYFDVPFAVTIFAIPNLIPNTWQAWTFRKHQLPPEFVIRFAVSGGIGAGIGSYVLANVASQILSIGVACVVFCYIAFRLLHPSWKLDYHRGVKLAVPVGIIAGLLQGGSGLSAPASLTFLNSMRLEREQFISTVSIFFVTLGVVQIPLLIYYGFMTSQKFILSCAALIPLVIFMPIGAGLVRHIKKETFDRLLLILLAILSGKLLLESFG